LQQIWDSVEKAATPSPVASLEKDSEPRHEIVVAREKATMGIFAKKSLPYLIYPGYLVALVIFAGNAKEHTWAQVGMYILIAPFPIVGGGLVILAYGEWIFNMKTLWQTDTNEFANHILIGLGKILPCWEY